MKEKPIIREQASSQVCTNYKFSHGNKFSEMRGKEKVSETTEKTERRMISSTHVLLTHKT